MSKDVNNLKNKKLRFAAIGTGWIFNSLKWIYKINKRACLVAVVDRNEELVKKHAKSLKIPWFTSSADLYNSDVEFDAVYIATPHHTHISLMKEAIEHKKHVFCDKPVTHTIEDGEEIVKLAQESGLKIGINYQYRYDTKAYSLVRACQDNALGKIHYATVSVPWDRGEKYYNQGPWRKIWKTSGGGTLLIHASHSIDVLIWALGKPKSVMGQYATRCHDTLGVEVEDIAMGIIKFESGAIAQVLSTACTKPNKPYVYINVFGERGNVKYTGPWPLSKLKRQMIPKLKYKLDSPGFINHSKILNGFIDWVWDDKPFYSTAETALTTLKVVLGIYESSRTGKRVEIN